MDMKNKIPVIITLAAGAYAIIAILQALERGSLIPESLCLIVILSAIAVLSWSGERCAEILTARKGAVIWIMILLFLIYGLLKGGAMI